MAQQLLTADVLHALKLSKELSVPAAPKEQQGIIGDFVDATQQGAYQGVAGIGEMVGAEGLRDWALEGADAQQATMSDVGREAMAKPIFQEDASGSLELGAGATDARAIALQLGQMIGMNADILAGGGVVKGARMAVTQVAKFARKKMAEKGVPSAFIDDAVNAASTSYLGKLAGKSPEELKSLMTSAADFGVAAHAVSGGLAAIDLREETRAMDFDELENLPEFQTVVRELAETNPQASALDILGAARDALGEQAASAIKTNPALLASNFLVGGLGAATLQRLLKGTIPVGAGIAAEVAAEGTQGAIEQYASNQVRQDLINPDQQLSEGVLSSAANEAAMGGAMGITAAAVPASVSGAKALQQQWQQRQTGQREEQQAAVLPELGGGDELTGFEDPLPTPDAPVKTPAGLSGFYDMASKVSQEHPDFADKVVSLVAEDPKRADAAARVLQRYVQDESFRNTADARLNEFTSGVKPKPVSLAEDVPLSEIYSAQPDEMDDLFGSVEWTPEMDADSAPQVSQSPSPVTNAVLDAAPQNVKDAANFAMESFEANGQYPDDELLRDTFDLAPDQVAEIKKLYAPAQDLSTEAVGNSPDIPPMPSIDVVAHEAATSPFNDLPEPTPAQKEAGNYRKAHLDVQGLKIAIENPKGSVRSGTDAGGKDWSIEMKDHYGYIKRTTGADGDQVDVFIGDEPDSDRVFIVDQYKADGSFDEHKVVLGARTLDQAKATYSRNYAEGWPVGPVKELTMPEFKSWLGQGDTTVPAQPEAVPEGSDLIAEFGPLRLEKYSEKSVVIRGDTKANSDLMKSLKGTFNPKLKGGGGWLFPATKADAVKQALSTAKLVAEPKQPTETEMSTLAKGETQTKAQQEAMTLLGAKAGEVIRTMGWGGVFQAGSMFTIEKVKPDGTVAMGVPGQKPSYFSLKDLQKAAKEGVIFEVQKPKQQPELLVSSAQQFEQHKQQLTGFADRVRGFNPEFSQRIEGMLPAAPDASYKPGAVFMELEKIKGQVELEEKRERLAKERKALEAEQLNKPVKGRKVTAPAAAAENVKVIPPYTPRHDWKDNPGAVQEYAEHLTQTGQLPAEQVKPNGAWAETTQLISLIEKAVRTNKDDVRTNSDTDISEASAKPQKEMLVGQLSAELASKIVRQKGEIRLEPGNDQYGLRHIELRHPEIGSTEAIINFVKKVASEYNQIWKAPQGQLLLVKVNGSAEVSFIQLKISDSGDFYTVNTAFKARREYAEKKGFQLLWSQSAPDSAGIGDQPPFVDSRKSANSNVPNASSKVTDNKVQPKPEESKLDKAADVLSDKKREALAKLKKLTDERKGQLNSGVDPEVLLAVAEVGAFSIAEGAVKFAQFVRDVIASTRAFGIDDDSVKPFLKEAYGAMAANPEKYGISDEIADTMDTARDIRKMDIAELLTELEQQNETSNVIESVDRPNQGGISDAAAGRNAPAQQRAASADTDSLASEQSKDGQNSGAGRAVGQAGVRSAGTDVAGSAAAGGSGDAGDGRQRASREKSPDAGKRRKPTTVSVVKPPESVSPANSGPGNFHIENPLAIVGGSQSARFEKNKAAIELYHQLQTENRQPTKEEQMILAGYTGWGSFGQALFQGSWERSRPQSGWESRDKWLREQLGKTEWEGMQRSITNAHYTDPPTVQAMWKMVQRMGFAGGRVQEPSIGIGNFFGMMPLELKNRSQLAGIELDPVTGGMAKMLYPDANIQVMGYQDSKTPDNFYDLIIGNWPFEDTVIADRRYNRLSPLLHDYFFLKTLDQVRPGGIVIGITSKGSLDKKSSNIRTELAKKAELVAAFRLPSGAFEEYAGTAVVTDIVILKKRIEPAGLVANEGWIQSVPYMTPQGEEVYINEYYTKNPSHVIGSIEHTQHGIGGRPGMVVKRPSNMMERLNRVIDLVPENVYSEAQRENRVRYITNHSSDREGALIKAKDGFFVVKGEYLAPAADIVKFAVKDPTETAKRESQISALVDMRTAYGSLVEADTGVTAAEPEPLRKALKKQYEAFTKEHGNLHDSFGLQYLKKIGDPFYAALAALESRSNGTTKPAAILTQSTIRTKRTLEEPSVSDAYVLARNESVNPPLARIAELAKKSPDQVKSELMAKGAVFELPGGDIVPSDIYLSGNVREKLRQALAAQEQGVQGMARNIEAIRAVLPKDIPYFNIEVQMGAAWVPTSAYASYIAHMLNHKTSEGVEVTYRAGRWRVQLSRELQNKTEARTGFGTPVYGFKKLVNAAFSNQTVTLRARDIDGNEYVDSKATAEVNNKISEMRTKFAEWLWSDPVRRVQIEQEYNEVRNAYATPNFDGSFLTFEGMVLSLGDGPFNLRSHQANAIWRALVTRKSLNAHEVGTGKTFTMGGIAVESRRYGLAKKPMILAHNANSKTVAAEILMMYPAAKVLYIDNLRPAEIAVRMRQIANDDWDAIVIPHSLIGHMALSEQSLMAMAQEEIDAIMSEAYDAAKDDGVEITSAMLNDAKELGKLRSQTAKDLVKLRNRIIENIKKQSQKASKDGAIQFEQLGIDMILVDEAHEFKKPPFATRMKMKGLNVQASDKSIALSFLTKYVRANNNGGNVHLFTGTPVTNTLTEVFHMQRYIMNEEMQAADVDQWDGWFGSFAREVMDVELNAAAEYEAVTRLAGFINVPELRQMIGQYMDIVFADDMPEMRPRKTKTGKVLASPNLTDDERNELLNGRTENAKDRPYKKIINETADLTPAQQEAFAQVQQYAQSWRSMTGLDKKEAMRSGAPESPIIYEGLAAKASFDVRLMQGEQLAGMEGKTSDDPNSKASKVVNNVLRIYAQDKRTTQVIFMQQGISKTASRSVGATGDKRQESYRVFSTAHDIIERLVQQGIPRNQIALVDGSTDKSKRKEIADAMNRSEIRVVLGSTQSLGVGVNMQKNLKAMHHMDAPWMPGDLEQRNGRGHRQGNQWNTVEEYRYLTDRIDGRRWQVLAVKDKFIKAFLKGNSDVRVIEGDAASDEESDILQSFSEAAGDPRILIRTKMQKKIEQLQQRKRMHGQGIYDAQQAAMQGKKRLVELDQKIDDIENKRVVEQAESITQATAGKGFSIELEGKSYVDRKEAQETIDFIVASKLRAGSEPIRIGKIAGHEVMLSNARFGEQFDSNSDPKLSVFIGEIEIRAKSQSLQSLESAIRSYPDKKAKMLSDRIELLSSIDRALDVSKEPFQSEKQLQQMEADLTALEQDISNNPVAPPSWLRSGAPLESVIYWKGNPLEVTGHRWNSSGWYVLATDKAGTAQVPYYEAQDEQGMPLYEKRDFISPEVISNQADSVVDIPASLGNGMGSNAVGGTPAHSQVGNGVEIRIAKAVALAFDNSLMNPGAGTLVVKKFEDFPEDIQSLASPDAAAFYWQDKVYVNLQHIRDVTDLQEVLVHERLRHGGLRLLFGRELWNELNRLATLIGPKKLHTLANKYNVYVDGYMQAYADNNHPFPDAALLDEVIAHIKEPDLPKGLWAMLHRWAAKVVQKLRDWGFDALANKLNTPEHEMLFDLVRRAKAKVVEGTPSAVKQKDFDAPMMLPKTGNAIADAVSQINVDRMSRMAQLFKPAKIWQAMKVKWPDLRPAMLQLIPRNYLADLAGDLLPSLRRYNNQVAAMEADRNHLLGITHETADKWRKLNGKNTKASIALADLMHEATLIGVDPSTSVFKPSITPQTYKVLIARAKEFIKARNGEAVAVARGMERMKRIKAAMDKVPEQDAAWHQLRQSYLALPAEYQQLFNEVRDSYKEMNDKRVEVLQQRIQDLIADKRVAAAQMRMMQEEFEVNELSGIYFPLQRFGKYRAAVKDTATNELIAFSMFDSNAEMQEWIRAKSAPGLSVVGGYEYEYSKLVDGVSMGFMKDLLDKFGMTFNRNNKIQDDLYQLFLEHNPSLSMRKHMIHRKGVAGFDQDALRAYAHNMFHSAYQISKTAHTHHMQAHILAMEEEANTIAGTDDRVRGIQVVNELNQRNEWILNPKGSEWAQKLTGFGFFWYLGTTPAAALVNVTQTAMVGLPILGARYSYKAAGQALYDVSKAFMKGRGHVDKTLAGHELAAFRELERSGIIDKTMAHDMTGIADGGVAYSPRYHQVMKVSGFLFHHAERFNREVTAMASYRLAYAKKMQQYGASGGLRAHKEAIQEAVDLTRLSHFDYANSNRPRFMQGDMARVLLLFRQHSVNMTYRLLRDFQQSFWGTGKDKEIARKQLAGMLGMTFLFAGAAGLPLYSLIAGIFNTLGGDEDEPFNFDESVRELLAEALGDTAASVVMSGIPGTVTGADLTNRIGMNNLWFRDADASLEGEAAVGYYAEQALGPMYGILTGWGRAVELAREGHTGKAWESATPKFARDWFKAVRYATDGVQTKRGDPILDEVSPWQIALQANGFSPLEISEQYQKNNALSGKVRAIRDRRQLLLNRWALGKRLGDYELEFEALAAIERFNQANPTVAIRSSDRVRSMRQRERISEQAVNGVIIPKKLNELAN